MRVAFTVPGDARGKGRPRATARGGFARMYTDAKTASYENLVALAAQDAMDGRPPITCPVAVQMRVRVKLPKNVSKKDRAAMLAGEIFPAKKPDMTNILKAVEDGANGIAYADDAQIVVLQATKAYADTPGVDVSVATLEMGSAAARLVAA